MHPYLFHVGGSAVSTFSVPVALAVIAPTLGLSLAIMTVVYRRPPAVMPAVAPTV